MRFRMRTPTVHRTRSTDNCLTGRTLSLPSSRDALARRHKTIRAEQIEELDKRPGRAAVFFYNGNLVVPADANGREFGEQKDALDAFRKSFTGLSKTYTNTDDLSTEVRNQLENWASDLAGQQPHTLLAAYSQLWKTEYITKYVNDASGKVTLLIYNTELQGFRSEVDFNETWSCLNGRGPISSIVFSCRHTRSRGYESIFRIFLTPSA